MNQKKKGNKAERDACKIWNTWAKGRYEYTRVPSSGGLRWHRTNDTSGDITSGSEGHKLQFCIEVKSHADIDFSQLLRNDLKNVKILEFWKQCTDDAKRCGKIPFLMCRYNGLPKGKFFIVMNLDDLINLGINADKIMPVIMASMQELIIFTSDALYNLDYITIHKNAKILNNKRNGKKKLKIKKTH